MVIDARTLRCKADVLLRVKLGDIVEANGFRVRVDRVLDDFFTNDAIVCGRVLSSYTNHDFDLLYDDWIYWGRVGIARTLVDYIDGRFVLKK